MASFGGLAKVMAAGKKFRYAKGGTKAIKKSLRKQKEAAKFAKKHSDATGKTEVKKYKKTRKAGKRGRKNIHAYEAELGKSWDTHKKTVGQLVDSLINEVGGPEAWKRMSTHKRDTLIRQAMADYYK
tara:strand:- start:388 stop:768 length:381 start_codon:yes stop_codon:yes gene_type:complete